MANSENSSVNQTINGDNNTQVIQEIVVNKEYFDSIILGKYPSIIHQVVFRLFEVISSDLPTNNGVPEYLPEDKIEHNRVLKYKDVIHAYGEYTQFLDSAYDSLESDTPGRRRRFLFYIHSQYLRLVGILRSGDPAKAKIDLIRDNADRILEDMINVLMISMASDRELPNVTKEELVVCIETIICHAFVECKILENPNL
jgi:hypothetical protein